MYVNVEVKVEVEVEVEVYANGQVARDYKLVRCGEGRSVGGVNTTAFHSRILRNIVGPTNVMCTCLVDHDHPAVWSRRAERGTKSGGSIVWAVKVIQNMTHEYDVI